MRSLFAQAASTTRPSVRALFANATGNDNTALAMRRSSSAETGYDNGQRFNALHTNTSGSFNTAIGSAALYSNETGIWNATGVGCAL
jgi:hypothetical protein